MALKLPVLKYYKDRKKEWRWRYYARNGKIVATGGEGYKTQAMAAKGFDSFATTAACGEYQTLLAK